jgi:hypothetical protein
VEDRLHKSQVDIVMGMNMIYETGLFDVSYAAAGRRTFAAFGESAWSWGSRGC